MFFQDHLNDFKSLGFYFRFEKRTVFYFSDQSKLSSSIVFFPERRHFSRKMLFLLKYAVRLFATHYFNKPVSIRLFVRIHLRKSWERKYWGEKELKIKTLKIKSEIYSSPLKKVIEI